MKVITFSKQFPKGHPRAGEPTHFVQKVLHALCTPKCKPITSIGWPPKFHTIRAGSRWKAGDMASLRIWSGAPYRSKQIEFAQVEVKKVWTIEINHFWFINNFICEHEKIVKLAGNDGLEYNDFIRWFNIHPKKKGETFKGQIITWNDKINY